MTLDFDRMPSLVQPRFKGGQGEAETRIFQDGMGKILRLTLQPGSSIGLHIHEDSCEIMYFLSGTGVCLDDGADTADFRRLLEEKYGKIKPGKREQKLIAACEKLGYCVQIAKPGRAALQEMARTWAGEYHTTFAPGAEAALLDRCGDDQFLLQNEIAKLAALSGYTTITTQMIQQLGTVTLDADTFDMVKLVAVGNTRQALAKLQTLLELQNEPILITGALIGNYLDIYRAFLAKKSRRPLADLAKDFKYTGKWNYRLGNADQTAARFQRSQIEESLRILQKLDLDLKGSRLDAPLLMQKAICELSLARSRA